MLIHPGRSVWITNRILTGISRSTVTDGDIDSNLHHLHTGNQDSSVFPPGNTGETMVPNLLHSDTDDTAKGFDQDLEQQGDQMLPYRGVTTGGTVRISNMLVHPGGSDRLTNRILTGVSRSTMTDGKVDSGLHHLHTGNEDSSMFPPAYIGNTMGPNLLLL